MADILHLRCHHCGEPLTNRHQAYCGDCNLYLARRAMPFLLGMILLPPFVPDPVPVRVSDIPAGRHLLGGYDDENALAWE